MDFLNKASAQVSDLFRSMTPAARITSALLLSVVLVSLFYLFSLQVSSADCDLMNGEPVAYTQLTDMKAAFGKAGLNTYEIRGTQILVPRGQRDRYMAALADGNALPPNIHNVLRKAIDDSSPFSNTKQQAERMRIGMQEAVSLFVAALPFVEHATVMYAKHKSGGFRKDTEVTASVIVNSVADEPLDNRQLSVVRRLVAASIGGLKAEEVQVAGADGAYYPGSSESGGSATDNRYVSLKRTHQQGWEARILKALKYVPGVEVTAEVTLDPNRFDRIESLKYDPKAVAWKSLEENSDMTREGGSPGGRPGIVAQGAISNSSTALAAASSGGSSETGNESKTETVSVPNTTSTKQEKEPLTPQRVAVTVSVPHRYIEKVWAEQNPAEEGQEPQLPDKAALTALTEEETAKIKRAVATLLPRPADPAEQVADLVTVEVFQDIKAPEIPVPAMTENAMAWFGQHWSMLGMVGLAAFSLVMLRSMVKAVPGVPDVASVPAGPLGSGDDEAETAEEAALNKLERFSGSSTSLRDEVSELVQEDMDAAANILKTWISSAG